MPESVLARIEEFLGQKRLAVIGVSRKSHAFSRGLVHELRRRGYEVALVNPQAAEIAGVPCHSRVQDVPTAVEAALIMTPPQTTAQLVRDCAEAGLARIWLHGKSATDEALSICRAHGIEPIVGQCPYMFLPDAEWIHRFHRSVNQLVGKYPK